METSSPYLISVQVVHTPSTDDPVGADEYYRMLGMVMMALGRLEGQFTIALLNLMNTPGSDLGYELPLSWRERARMWRQAFRAAPMLQQHKDGALALVTAIMDLVEDRNALSHAMWQGFIPGAGLTVATAHISKKRKTTDGLDFRRADISIDNLREILRKANLLNSDLLPLSQFLCSLRPAPPEALRA